MVQPLDTPGCVGRRNCNVNLDNRRWDRPDQDCQLQQARDIPRNLQVDETLRDGLDLAHRCRATPLADRAVEELRAAGGRPRRRAGTGADALTASELRVAELAAGGVSNREIAQSLFVTLRTVELHLSNAYSKLEIRSRHELGTALER